MMNTGAIPACASDLNNTSQAGLAGERETLYKALEYATQELRKDMDNFPTSDDVAEHSRYVNCLVTEGLLLKANAND